MWWKIILLVIAFLIACFLVMVKHVAKQQEKERTNHEDKPD
ncbi:MAG: hypothetical protein ACK5MJ_00190 [Alphaproteobacteria bacterium]